MDGPLPENKRRRAVCKHARSTRFVFYADLNSTLTSVQRISASVMSTAQFSLAFCFLFLFPISEWRPCKNMDYCIFIFPNANQTDVQMETLKILDIGHLD